LSTKTREVFSSFSGQNSPKHGKIPLKQGLKQSQRLFQLLFLILRWQKCRILLGVLCSAKKSANLPMTGFVFGLGENKSLRNEKATEGY